MGTAKRSKTPPTPRPPSQSATPRSIPEDVDAANLKVVRQIVRPQLRRPRPMYQLRPNLDHTVILRPNDFTTSTTDYRTYGSQWVLTQRPNRGKRVLGAAALLRADINRERAEIQQREE